MKASRHRRLTQGFLVANSLFWLPWGLVNLIKPESWSGEVIPGMEVYDLSVPSPAPRSVPCTAASRWQSGPPHWWERHGKKHRDSALGFFVLALSGLSLCRLGGMVVEGEASYLSFSTRSPPGSTTRSGWRCMSCRT